MDCRSSCHAPNLRMRRHAPFHNGEYLRSAAPGLHELVEQVRCSAVTLRPGAWLPACASTDVRRRPHCLDRRRSTTDGSRRTASVDTPSGPVWLRRAIANHQETVPGG